MTEAASLGYLLGCGTGLVQIDHGLQLVSREATTHTLRASADRADLDLRPLNPLRHRLDPDHLESHHRL
ncbi:MAG: hypothetical protein M3460_27710 [Actinomycetota bacterium]|nr:hypothetical protein [Actinomycetota bacterium]